MTRVLVTGASGFIGRSCLSHLVARGVEVHPITLPSIPPPPGTGATWHRCDLMNFAQAAEVVKAVGPTHLLHLAWIVTPGVYWTSPLNTDWLAASTSLLETFVARGGKRVVMSGTCAEYDWSAGICRERETPLHPTSPYGRAKAELFHRLDAANSPDLSTAWARIFWLYGPNEPENRLVPSLVLPLLRGERATCSAGENRRDFLHVDDVAAAIVSLLLGDVRGPVNIASGQAVAIAEIARTIGRLTGGLDRIDFASRPPAGDPPLVVGDNARLRDEVRFTPRWDLQRGLASAIDWWRANR